MRVTPRSPQGGRLQTIFFPAEPKPVMPSEVSDEIILTHPAIPPMVGFKEGRFFFEQIVAPLGNSRADGSLVPTDRYWWIQFVQFFHNDTVTDRRIRLSIRDTVINDCAITTDSEPIGANIIQALERPIILPNDTRLAATVSGLGASFAVTLRFYFYELLHAEVNPSA